MRPLHDVVCCLLEKPFTTWFENHQLDLVKTGPPRAVISKLNHWTNKLASSQTCYDRSRLRWSYPDLSTDLDFDLLDAHCSQYTHIFFSKKLSILKGEEPMKVVKSKCVKVKDRLTNETKEAKIVTYRLTYRKKDRNLADDPFTIQMKEEAQFKRKCSTIATAAILHMIRKGIPICVDGVRGSHASIVETLVSQSSDLSLKMHFDKTKSNVKYILSREMQHLIVSSITDFVGQRIKEAVNNSDFFVVRLDEGLNDTVECVYLRCFVATGVLKEYFLGYTTRGGFAPVRYCRLLLSILEGYQYKSKLVGMSYDITRMRLNFLKELRVQLKAATPQVVNVNLLSHSLDFVFERRLCKFPSVRKLFGIVNSLLLSIENLKMYSYAWSSKYCGEFDGCETPCFSKRTFLTAVIEDWAKLAGTLIHVTQNTSVPDKIKAAVSMVLLKMGDPKFVFLLCFIVSLFNITSSLSKDLQDNCLRAKFCHDKVKAASATLYSQRNVESYYSLVKKASAILSRYPGTTLTKAGTAVSLENKNYMPLYFDMIDVVVMELHTRFDNIEQYEFLDLGESSSEELQDVLPKETSVENLMSTFPNLFKDKDKLMTELQRFRKDCRFWQSPLLTSIQLLSALKNDFEEVHKLLRLIALLTPSPTPHICIHKSSNYLKKVDPHLKLNISKVVMNPEIQELLNRRCSLKEDILKNSLLPGQTQLSSSKNNNASKVQRSVLPSNMVLAQAIPQMEPICMLSVGGQLLNQDMPGPSSQTEPDCCSLLEDNIHQAMSYGIYPDLPDSSEEEEEIEIKEEPAEKKFKPDIPPSLIKQEVSLNFDELCESGELGFDIPVLIKEEIVSSEDEL